MAVLAAKLPLAPSNPSTFQLTVIAPVFGGTNGKTTLEFGRRAATTRRLRSGLNVVERHSRPQSGCLLSTAARVCVQILEAPINKQSDLGSRPDDRHLSAKVEEEAESCLCHRTCEY